MSDDATTISRQAKALVGGTGRFEIIPERGSVALRIDASLPARALIGTSSTCLLRLDDRTLSRRHAALEVEGRLLKLTDLGSTNGTFVNGVEVREAWFSGGETVRLGDCTLRVQYGGEDAADYS